MKECERVMKDWFAAGASSDQRQLPLDPTPTRCRAALRSCRSAASWSNSSTRSPSCNAGPSCGSNNSAATTSSGTARPPRSPPARARAGWTPRRGARTSDDEPVRPARVVHADAQRHLTGCNPHFGAVGARHEHPYRTIRHRSVHPGRLSRRSPSSRMVFPPAGISKPRPRFRPVRNRVHHAHDQHDRDASGNVVTGTRAAGAGREGARRNRRITRGPGRCMERVEAASPTTRRGHAHRDHRPARRGRGRHRRSRRHAEEERAEWARDEREAREAMHEAAEAFDGIASSRIEVGDGGPAICAVAEELGAEIIVMGTRGRGMLRSLLFGSTVQHVIRHSHCPVLLGHADAHPRNARSTLGGRSAVSRPDRTRGSRRRAGATRSRARPRAATGSARANPTT